MIITRTKKNQVLEFSAKMLCSVFHLKMRKRLLLIIVLKEIYHIHFPADSSTKEG